MKKTTLLAMINFALVIAMLMVMPATALSNQTADQQMTYAVRNVLKAYPNIQIESMNGSVTLSGTVLNPEHKAAAVAKTKDVRGVRQVIDDIRIDPNPKE